MNTAELAEALTGKLCAEDCADLSDAELMRCLVPCVSGHTLVPLAKSLRDSGKLVMVNGVPELIEEKIRKDIDASPGCANL